MKKLKKIFLIIAVFAVTIFSFTACVDDEPSVNGTMTLVVGTETPIVYTVDLDDVKVTEGVLSIIKYLNETKDLVYVAETSTYGAYLTKVGVLEQNLVTSTYLYVYTSVEKDFDVSAYAVSIGYDGKVLMSSGLGVSEMTIESDCVIYIRTITF